MNTEKTRSPTPHSEQGGGASHLSVFICVHLW
jgi:hypothetical protein